jgi:hypothetical protein
MWSSMVPPRFLLSLAVIFAGGIFPSRNVRWYREQALGKWATYSGGCYYAFGYLLISHEENYGVNKVILMKEQDIQAEVERRSQEGYDVAPKRNENFTGQQLLKPKSSPLLHG